MKEFSRACDRSRWAIDRARMEAGDEKSTVRGPRRRRNWTLFKVALMGFGVLLRVCGLWRRGVRNALAVELEEVELRFDRLPAAFDGYRILQVSDPHLDAMPEFAERIAALVRRAPVDLCVLTGDYRFRVHGPFDGVRAAFDRLLPEIDAADGIFAILGNHDSVEMVPMFEAQGVHVLVNQTVSLSRGAALLHLTGVDDAYYYYTQSASHALRHAPDGFRVALAHSPELAPEAADAGIDLYLTGHTHGGQVCLPGRIAVFTHSLAPHRLASGLWREGAMTGYTSRGAGCSGLPVRFNCPGEVTVFTLRVSPTANS